MKLSVILVNYKNSELTIAGLNKTRKHLPPNTEYIIVDNSESLCEVSRLSQYVDDSTSNNVKLIVNSANLGFGHACNLGASVASASVLLFLNNDTWIHSSVGWNVLMDGLLDSECTGAISCRVQDLHGNDTPLWPARLSFAVMLIKITRIGYLFNNFPPFSSVKRLLCKLWPTGSSVNTYLTPLRDDCPRLFPVNSIGGSAFLIRKSVFFLVQGFDDRFFLYDEDTDLFERLSSIGRQHYFFSGLISRGYVSASTSRLSTNRLNKIKYDSRLLLLQKHFTGVEKIVLVCLHRITYCIANVSLSFAKRA